MLHQLSEDGRAFLPQEQLKLKLPASKVVFLEGFVWEQSFFGGFHYRPMDLSFSFCPLASTVPTMLS